MKRIIAILLAGLLLLSLCACGKKSPEEQTEEVSDAIEVTALQYSDGNALKRFSRTEDGWKWTDGVDFPLDETCVEQMIEDVRDILQADSIGKTEDVSIYGLDSTTKYVVITDPEKSIRLSFGKQNADGDWYMSRDDQEGFVYLVKDAVMKKLATPVYDMAILPVLPQFTRENLQRISLQQADTLQLHLRQKDGKWVSGTKVVSAENLEKELGELTLTKCVDYQPSEGAVSLCGLDIPLNVTVSYVNSVDAITDWVLHIGNPAIDEAGYYVSLGEDSTIYEMPAENLTALLQLAEQNRVIPPETDEAE